MFLIIYIVFDIFVVPSLKRISHIQNAYIQITVHLITHFDMSWMLLLQNDPVQREAPSAMTWQGELGQLKK